MVDDKEVLNVITSSVVPSATDTPSSVSVTFGGEDERWVVIEYEVQMFRSDTLIRQQSSLALQNAAVESRLLHTRNLCEVFLELAKEQDDIVLSKMFADWTMNPRYDQLKHLVGELSAIYGKSKDEGSPRWVINKRLAHSTTHRAAKNGYEYAPHLEKLIPKLHEVINQLEALRRKQFPPIT
jgi:hypothetical protein